MRQSQPPEQFVAFAAKRDLFNPPPALQAVVTLNSLHRARSSIHILSEELIAKWRTAGREDPAHAIDWWKSSEAIGFRLHTEIPVEEVADLFESLSPMEAACRLMNSEDQLEEIAARRLARAYVLRIWNEAFDDVDEDEPLWAWGNSNPLGTALRRHVGPDLLEEKWRAGASLLLEVAFMLWEPDHPIGPALRHHLDAKMLLPLWQQLAVGPAGYATELFDRAPKQVLEHASPLDLAPLATSTSPFAREGALRHLKKMIARGLAEPEDPDVFIDRWREVASNNGEWAATLLLAAPTTVRNRLEENDLIVLLQSPDREARLKAVANLRKQRLIAEADEDFSRT